LENILESGSKSLVAKATEVLEHIKTQSALDIETTSTSIDEDSIFNLDFELELNEPAEQKNIEPSENGSTLFDQLCSMSNSLYNKLNG
ncbi:MAG: hypothetical protein ABJI22_10595, partial [Maribacter sp.]